MKRLKIFPKTFLYTLALMLLIVVIAHALIYFLAPRMILSFDLGENVASDGAFVRAELDLAKMVTRTILKALPISLICCILISINCSLLFSKKISIPIKHISSVTEDMIRMEKAVTCKVYSQDEIGVLADNINGLYQNLLSTIDHLEAEQKRVSESEKSKVDFLRAASHELKTPVTTLNAMLENMILGVGKYQDFDTYLPECKETVEQLSNMLHDILETSKAGLFMESETKVQTDLSELLTLLCQPYELIAKAHGKDFSLDVSNGFTAMLPQSLFSRAVSNILANAVSYADKDKLISIYFEGRSIVVENECTPIATEDIRRLFEPFYRPDYARSRDDGGNGLGLYLVDALFRAMDISYSFAPMDSPPGMRFTFTL